MDRSRQVHGQRRGRRWAAVAATAALVLGLGTVASPVAAYSGPSDFQSMGGGLGSSTPDGVGTLYASARVGGTIYIGGDFQTAGGADVGPVAQWTGTAWAAVGTPADGPSGFVVSMTTDGTNLYVGGDFGVFEFEPATSTWTDLNWPNSAQALTWYDDGTNPAHLVAGGNDVNGGLCRFGRYVDSIWRNVINITASDTNCAIFALAAMNHQLYVGGYFTDKGATPANNLLMYDGATNSWSPVNGTTGNGVTNGTGGAMVFAMTADEATSTLFVGGVFDNASGTSVNAIASYHAGAFSDVANSATELLAGSEVDALLSVAGTPTGIAAGGSFSLASGASTVILANLDVTGWLPMGQGTDDFVNTLLLVDDSNLLIGGDFTTAYRMSDDTAVADTMGVALFGPTPVAPTWNSPLTMSGTQAVGQVLTAHADVSGDPAPDLTYQWFRCTAPVQFQSAPAGARRLLPPTCTVIDGATAHTYTVTSADIGMYLGVYADARNIAGGALNLISSDAPVPALPTTTTTAPATTTPATTTPTTPDTTTPGAEAPATSEPVLPATGSGGSVPAAALVITGLGLVLLVPARRRWLR